MTPQTGIAPIGSAVPGAVDGGLQTPQHPEERPPADPEPGSRRLGAVPLITLRRSTYRITATTAEGRFLATAVRNLWGWHVSTSRRDEVLTWASCDTTFDAVRAVHDVAALRLASRTN